MRRLMLLCLLFSFAAVSRVSAQEEPMLLNKKASEWAALLQGEQDQRTRQLAALAIGHAGMRPGLYKAHGAKRLGGLRALRILGPEKYPAGVAVIVTALQVDPDPDIRSEAVQVLVGMYEKIEKGKFAPAREAIVLALRSDASPRVREAAATALGQIDPEEGRAAVALLQKALRDDSADVARAAADTLRRLGKEAGEAAPALVALVKDGKADVLARTLAALALGRIGSPDASAAGAISALKEAILSGETPPELRLACVASVGFFGKEAAEAVPAVGALLALKTTPLDLRRKAVDTLDQLGLDARAATADLLKALKDDDKHVRVRAVHALAIMGRELGPDLPAAVRGFNEALGDSTVDVRIGAIQACVLLGPEGLGDSLQTTLDKIKTLSRDTQKDVAETAKNALSKLAPPQP